MAANARLTSHNVALNGRSRSCMFIVRNRSETEDGGVGVLKGMEVHGGSGMDARDALSPNRGSCVQAPANLSSLHRKVMPQCLRTAADATAFVPHLKHVEERSR